jgi:hypothetical protein
MDSQGFDVRIFESGKVDHPRVWLQSELAIKKIYKESVDYKDAIEVYRSAGFELSALVPNNSGHFPRLIEIELYYAAARLARGARLASNFRLVADRVVRHGR